MGKAVIESLPDGESLLTMVERGDYWQAATRFFRIENDKCVEYWWEDDVQLPNNPTHQDLMNAAQRFLDETDDFHVFYEGCEIHPENHTILLVMGS